MQKYLKCLDSSPENGTFDMFCTSDHGNISFQLGNIFYGFQLADSMVTLGEPRDAQYKEYSSMFLAKKGSTLATI